VGLAGGVAAVASGWDHTCALTISGGIKCWGGNYSGQLGDGTTTTRLIPVDVVGLASGLVAIGTGFAYNCAVLPSGSLKCWGSNNSGQLGDNSTTNRPTPVDVGEKVAVDVASPRTAQSISFGSAPSVFVGGTGTASATATSGLAVTFTSNTTSVCSVSGSTVTGVSAGTCTITASQIGNSTYLAAEQVALNITISQPVTYSYSACVTCHSSVTAQAHVGTNAGSCAACHGVGKVVDYLVAHNSLSAASKVLTFVSGWNLVGNSVEASINVSTTFSDQTKVNSVWKWISSGAKWAFYTPSQNDGGAAYAAIKGYSTFATINAGEGFWVNAQTAFTVPLPAGTSVKSTAFQTGGTHALPSGWSLIATGDSQTPTLFNAALAPVAATPPSPGYVSANLTTLWAWDATKQNWYFWAPSRVNSGTLASYISSKNFLDSATMPNGTLSPATGFWVNMP